MKTSIPIPQLTANDITRFRAKTRRLPNGCIEWTASKERRGYGRFSVMGQVYFAHRIAYAIAHGPFDRDLIVDHQCFNKSCVNPDHLRLVTPQQNSENRECALAKNYSRVRNVHWRPEAGTWQVSVGHNHRIYYGGCYKHLKDAKQAATDLRSRLMTNDTMDFGRTTNDLHPVTIRHR